MTSAPGATHGAAVFAADLWLLLTLRFKVGWNSFAGRPWPRKLITACTTLLVGGGSAFGTGAIGYGLGQLVVRYPRAQLESLLPGAVLTAATVLVLVVSFGVALGSLFLAGDLELLMTAPVDSRAVFMAKVLDGMALYYTVLAVLAVPALLAYGVALSYGPLYFALTLLALLGTPLLPVGVAALLVMIVARFAPARRVREVLGLAVAVTGMSCSLAGQTARAWTRPFAGANGNADAQAVLAQLRELAALPIPSFVAGRGLVAAGAGHTAAALSDLSGFLVATFGFFAVCVWLADAMYATGWVRMQGSGVARRGQERAAREAARGGWLGRAPAFAAIALKDWRVILRDLRNFAQLLAPLLLLPAIYFNLLAGSGRRSSPFETATRWAGAVDLRGVAVAAGVLVACVLITGRVALTGVSREGAAWWLLKSAPLDGTELLLGKLTVVGVPYVLLSTVLMAVAAVWNRFSLLGTLYGWYGVQLLGLAVLAIYVACGVPWARLDWDDPRRMTSGWATIASFLCGAVLDVLVGALLCLPLLAQAIAPSALAAAWVFGAGGALVVAAGAGALAIQIGVARLPAVGEAQL